MRHTLRVAKTKDESDKWDVALVKRVGAAVKAARGSKSAAWLSDRTAALGYRISPTVIAKLDSGHRGSVLSVPELLVLAVALEIPPALLLLPSFPDGSVEVAPGQPVPAHRAREWLCGDAALPVKVDEAGVTGHYYRPNRGVELVGAVAEKARQENELGRLQLKTLDEEALPAERESAQRTFAALAEHQAAIATRIADAKAALWGDSAEDESDG
jgi:hypothetical protein